jgi:hypothetical protein
MKIGEYRTNGRAVACRRDAIALLVWPDADHDSDTYHVDDDEADTMTHGWRTMLPGEVSLWCAPPSPTEAVSAKDWMGMWDVARARADKAEAEAKRLRAIIATACTTLHPTIELSNASYQEGYRYAAARVLAILGDA